MKQARQTKEQQYELIRRAQAGDDSAMAEMVETNRGLVTRIAQRYTHICTHLEFGDLVQEGKLGLFRAVQKFDLTRDLKFSTYAYAWVLQHILRAIENQDKTIRIPTHAHAKRKRLWKAGIENELPAVVLSLDLPIHGKSDETDCMIINFVADLQTARTCVEDEAIGYTGPGPGGAIYPMDLVSRIMEPMRSVLIWRFGLDGNGERSLQEIALLRGNSREGVRQIELRGIQQLRALARKELE